MAESESVTIQIEDGKTVKPKPHFRDRTPDAAVEGFDGTFTETYGRDIRTRCCTRQLFNFVMAALVIGGALVACLIILFVRGFDAPGTSWLQAIVTFCLGVFVPNPRIVAKPRE